MNPNKLILVKSPVDDSWMATYNNEEAHNIEGDTHEERLQNAANIWGLTIDKDVDKDVDYEILG